MNNTKRHSVYDRDELLTDAQMYGHAFSGRREYVLQAPSGNLYRASGASIRAGLAQGYNIQVIRRIDTDYLGRSGAMSGDHDLPLVWRQVSIRPTRRGRNVEWIAI